MIFCIYYKYITVYKHEILPYIGKSLWGPCLCLLCAPTLTSAVQGKKYIVSLQQVCMAIIIIVGIVYIVVLNQMT